MGARSIIAGLLTLAVISTIAGVYHNLNSVIKEQNILIKELKLKVADTQVQLQLEQAGTIVLKNEIKKQSDYINKMKVDTEAKLKEYKEWSKNPDRYNQEQFNNIINFDKLRTGSCDEMFKYMSFIRSMRYEDL